MAEELTQNQDTKVFNPETDIIDVAVIGAGPAGLTACLLYTSPSPRDLSTSRMPSSA